MTCGSRWRRAVSVTRTCRCRRGRSRSCSRPSSATKARGSWSRSERPSPAVVPGDHVVLTWMPACRNCFWCLRGQVMLCEVGLTESLSGAYADGARDSPRAGARHRHLRRGDPGPRGRSRPRRPVGAPWSSPLWSDVRWPPVSERCGTPRRCPGVDGGGRRMWRRGVVGDPGGAAGRSQHDRCRRPGRVQAGDWPRPWGPLPSWTRRPRTPWQRSVGTPEAEGPTSDSRWWGGPRPSRPCSPRCAAAARPCSSVLGRRPSRSRSRPSISSWTPRR